MIRPHSFYGLVHMYMGTLKKKKKNIAFVCINMELLHKCIQVEDI